MPYNFVADSFLSCFFLPLRPCGVLCDACLGMLLEFFSQRLFKVPSQFHFFLACLLALGKMF